MKQHPILFCGEMVRAILEDRKHQTRRMLNPQPVEHAWEQIAGHKLYVDMVKTDRGMAARIQHVLYGLTDTQWFTPKYQPGDQLWVRETFRVCDECRTLNFAESVNEARYYKSRLIGQCSGCDETIAKWTPSIFMPRRYSRISLEVDEVRCQQVQDISEEDAMAEGFPNPEGANRNYQDRARYWFENLWQSINNNWDANPYVFAYTFRKL